MASSRDVVKALEICNAVEISCQRICELPIAACEKFWWILYKEGTAHIPWFSACA